MAVGRSFYCDGDGCDACTQPINEDPPFLPHGWIEVTQWLNGKPYSSQFCSFNCVLHWSAQFPPPEPVTVEAAAQHPEL